ncbi:hypothetical protein [Ornithinibacillus contaminans]|uniref:hypothetical protein n=1 Tax=Ornithinibacillus contaminans TaxID=694055 RepID=UPI00064DA684|nr:hypothetical protein [Ornithinibacillus contaminans]
MKLIKWLLIIVVFLGVIGYGVYYFGTKVASDKLMEVVSTELENSGQMETIKQAIENDPQLKGFLEGAETVDERTLPFTTKEEATRMIVKKVGISGIQDIQSKVQAGDITRNEILQEIEENFTEEEIMALKVIAYKEIYNN